MRYFIIGFLVIVLAVQGILLMLFSATGNDLLLPHVNAYLKEDIKKYKVEISKFRLGFNTLSFAAKVNESIDVKSQGKIDFFTQTFDMDYIVEAEELKTETISLKEHINVKGNIQGQQDNMMIKGKGIAFESDIAYDLRKVEDNLQDIKIQMKKAKISKILAVLNYDGYAEGLLTLDVDMPEFDALNPQGKAKIFIPHLTLNEKKISKDFNIQLPEKTLIAVEVDAKTKDEVVLLEGALKSNLANLDLLKGTLNPASKDFDVSYQLDVTDLSKLNTLAKRDLHGTLQLSGSASQKNHSLNVSGSTKSFGGESKFIYLNDTLDVIFDSIKTETLLYKLGEKNYMTGVATAKINLNSLKRTAGTFDASVKGDVNTKVAKEVTKTDLGQTFQVDAKLQGNIKDKKVHTTILLNTTMANIKAEKFIYDLKKKSILSDYQIDIPDMSKLKPLTRKAFKGDMYLHGDIKKEKDLIVTGQGKEFDGSIDFTLVNDDLKADITGATVSKVMHMLGYPQVIEAVTEAKVDYNVKNLKGTVNGTLNNARILPSELTIVLEQFAKMNLTHNRFNNSKFLTKIDKDIIYFSLDASNKRNYVRVTNGVLDKRTDAVRADVDVEIEGKDVTATIQGTLEQPKVMLDSSKYLEKKINKNIDKLIDKNIKGEGAEQIKSLLKGFL